VALSFFILGREISFLPLAPKSGYKDCGLLRRSLAMLGMTGIIREDRGEVEMAATQPFPPLPLSLRQSLSFRTDPPAGGEVRNPIPITGCHKTEYFYSESSAVRNLPLSPQIKGTISLDSE
jgi:hypothetical protein